MASGLLTKWLMKQDRAGTGLKFAGSGRARALEYGLGSGSGLAFMSMSPSGLAKFSLQPVGLL